MLLYFSLIQYLWRMECKRGPVCLHYLFILSMIFALAQSELGKSKKRQTCAKELHLRTTRIPRYPLNPKQGNEPTVCVSSPTCCTQNTEKALKTEAKNTLRDIITTRSEALKNAMTDLNMDLKGYSTNLVRQAHKETLDFVSGSYGKVSQPSAEILGNLFKEMENYLVDETLVLQLSLDRFYKDLFPIIYKNLPMVKISQVGVQQSYLDCMRNKYDDIKPYGALPRNVHTILYNSLFPMQAFIRGLEFGANLADTMGTLHQVSDLCVENYLKMNYCSMCKGFSKIKPCHQMCLDVYTGCFSVQMKIHNQWISYLDTMETLADSLKKSLNMEKVIFTVHRHITDAVTYVMANLDWINNRAKIHCGTSPHLQSGNQIKPGVQPNQLPAGGANAVLTQGVFNAERKLSIVSNGIMMDDGMEPQDELTGSLSKKMDILIRNMTLLKAHFASMPEKSCHEEKTSPFDRKDKDCWNGQSKGQYTSPVGGVKADISTDDNKQLQKVYAMFVAASKPINLAKLLDKSGTRKDGDFYIDGSGSGDGEQSGNRPTDCEDDDEDCNSGFGSGTSPDNTENKTDKKGDDTDGNVPFIVDGNDLDEDNIGNNGDNANFEYEYDYSGPKSGAKSGQFSATILTVLSTFALLMRSW